VEAPEELLAEIDRFMLGELGLSRALSEKEGHRHE
jgi:hypothetical protein